MTDETFYGDWDDLELIYSISGQEQKPVGTPTGASEISGEDATLNAKITDRGDCSDGTMSVKFRYKKTSDSTWTELSWDDGNYSLNDTYSTDLTGLDYGDEYEYQTKVKCSLIEGDWSSSSKFTAGVDPPTAIVSAASSISQYAARLNGQITDRGSCTDGEMEARFRYRIVGNIDWTETAWQNTLSQSDTYYADITGLKPGVTYEFQTQGKGTCGIGTWSDTLQFTTTTPTSPIIFSSVGNYVEIDFGAKYQIGEIRHYGESNMNGDGDYKLQYWDGSAFQDLLTGISTRGASWSDWQQFPSVISSKVRIVATTLDSYGDNRAWEFEIQGGAGGTRKFQGEASDATSITKYGEIYKRYSIGYVNSDAECEEIAEKLLRPDSEEGGTIKIPFNTANMINESIHLEDDRFGIDGDFAVTDQKINYASRMTTLQLGFKDDFAVMRQRAKEGALNSQEAMTIAEGSNAYMDKDDR